MVQVIQVHRTGTTNAPPASLKPGVMAAALGTQTKLWLGDGIANRLLLSSDPADMPAAGMNYLPLAGGTVGSTTFNGGVGWSSHNMGRQLLVTSPGLTNPAIGITDASGNNALAIVNAGGSLLIAGMPAYDDSTSAPVMILSLNADTTVAFGAWQFSGAVALAQNPTTALHATNKQYVDQEVAAIVSATTLAGSYNAALDEILPVLGVAVAGPLPPAGPANSGWYLIVTVGGLGSGNAPPTDMAAGDWLISNGTDWIDVPLDIKDMYAINVAVAPIPGQAGVDNVQSSLEYLQSIKLEQAHTDARYLPLSGGNLSGNLYAPHLMAIQAGGNAFVGSWDSGNASAVGFWNFDNVLYFGNANGDGTATASRAYIDAGGNMTLNGALIAPGGVYPSTVNGSEWLLSSDAGTGDKYQTYRATWFDVWRGASGLREWYGNGSQLMFLDGAGNLHAAGNLNAFSIVCTSGLFEIAPNFYMQRAPTDGAWRWVEAGSVNMTLDTSAHLIVRGPISSGGNMSCYTMFCDNLFMDPGGSYCMFTGADQTRWLQFQTGWSWGWDNSQGNLTWNNPNAPTWGLLVGGQNGNCFNNGGVWYALSDARLKQDIADYSGGLDAILALRPRTFRKIADVEYAARTGAVAPRKIGLIAQECELVIPETVLREAREFAGVHYADMRHYDSSPVLYALVNAVKELDARLAALENYIMPT